MCAKELSKETIYSLEQQVVVLVCKLEKIFPPGFFNPMQHLIIHLPCEARLGGPVQSRWSYPYERRIQKLRRKVKNRARVEGCIVEAELVEEATNHLSLFFRPEARSVRNKIPRYNDGASTFTSSCNLEIFKYPGRCMSPRGVHELSTEECEAAFLYILTNMLEMDELFKKFDKEQWMSRSIAKPDQLRDLRLNGWKNSRGRHGPNFFDWLKEEYWTSNEYKDKRRAAQASRVKPKDVAPNRGGSRPWGETQQLLEYKFGHDKAGTLNTYAIMKSGFKKVDNTGRSAPIPSQRAQNRLDNYNARTQLAENLKELDAQALYFMEGGLVHGRVPIADGVVDKETLIATAKS
ncbi:hypothetical protein E2562_003788, partial [Oryza meyeriana var. granulata]